MTTGKADGLFNAGNHIDANKQDEQEERHHDEAEQNVGGNVLGAHQRGVLSTMNSRKNNNGDVDWDRQRDHVMCWGSWESKLLFTSDTKFESLAPAHVLST